MSERIPCTGCTSEIYCEENGCKFPRASELRTQPAAQPAQPVAWLCEWDNWQQYHDASDPLPSKWDDEVPKITPLYAAPQPAQEGAECWLTKNSFGNCAKGHLPKLIELPAHEGVTGERAMLKALFAHWNEFGPEHGFGELIDRCEAGLTTLPPSPKTGEGSAIRDALRLMQEMWDELERRKLNHTLMRQYADALSVLEKDFLKRIAEGEGFIGGGDSTRVTDAMVEAGAKALAGSMADPHNAAWGRKWARAVLEAANGVREDGNV